MGDGEKYGGKYGRVDGEMDGEGPIGSGSVGTFGGTNDGVLGLLGEGGVVGSVPIYGPCGVFTIPLPPPVPPVPGATVEGPLATGLPFLYSIPPTMYVSLATLHLRQI